MAEEAWFSDQTAIFVQEEGGTEINMTVKVLSIKESGFERETEGTVTFGDGRIVQKKPQKDGTVEIEFVMTNSMADKMFWGSTAAGTVPETVYSGGEQNKHRITILRTADAVLPTTAITTATTVCLVYRYGVDEPKMTKDDWIDAWGVVAGTYQYTDSDGLLVTGPMVLVVYWNNEQEGL